MDTKINTTHAAIQELYDEPLTAYELAEAERVLIGFFKVLVKIDQRNKQKKKHENHQS